jgi:hypothetical protein
MRNFVPKAATGSRAERSVQHRAAGAFVLAALAIGCLAFWVGAPLAVLWALGRATNDRTTHYVAGVIAAPLAMALLSPALLWLNNLYLRVTGVLERLDRDERESGWRRRVRGPLEPILMLALAAAIVALIAWFLFAAHNPSPQVI